MSEVPFQLACDCGGAPGAWAVDETLRTLMRKTIDPLAQGRIGKLERVGDGLQTLPLDDVAHSLGTAADAGVFGVLYEGVSGRQGGGGKTQFQSPHLRVSSNKLRQKYAQPTSHDAVPLLSAQNLFDSNFPEAAYVLYYTAARGRAPAHAPDHSTVDRRGLFGGLSLRTEIPHHGGGC